jgi:cell division protein FtsW
VAKKLSSDPILFTVTVALLGFGLVMVWSASSALAQEAHGNAYYFLVKQLLWACLGLASMLTVMRYDYRNLRRPAFVYGALAFTSLLLIVVLFLSPLNETRRWIRFGQLSFQPAELAKFSLVLYLAYHLERRGERVHEWLTTLFPPLLVLGWFAFLIYIQPDLGSAATLALITAVMLFVSGVRLRYFAVLALLAVPLLYQGIMAASYRRGRLLAFFDPWADPLGAGYQIIQSLTAVGLGGVTGVGLMEGRQKLFYLPYPYSDFIFAVIGEELGMLGACAVAAGFLLFLWRGLRAAWNAPDRFGFYLAAGTTLTIVLQALVNMSVVLGLLPTKGIPLPFVSAGGSSLLLTLTGVGLVLSVSQHAD